MIRGRDHIRGEESDCGSELVLQILILMFEFFILLPDIFVLMIHAVHTLPELICTWGLCKNMITIEALIHLVRDRTKGIVV